MRRRSRLHLYAAIAVLTAACVALAVHGALPVVSEPEDYYGTPVEPETASFAGGSILLLRDEKALDVRERVGCRPVRLGLAPWNPDHVITDEWAASTRVALLRMGLPLDAANQALQSINLGHVSDAVAMDGNGGIALHGRQTYLPVFSTTFKTNGDRFVCHDTRLNLAGRQENALLYRVGDYHVAVFLRCGNVSLLIPGEPQAPVATSVRTVPEPSTLLLMAVALMLLIFFRKQPTAPTNHPKP